jgi:hypothetical protein
MPQRQTMQIYILCTNEPPAESQPLPTTWAAWSISVAKKMISNHGSPAWFVIPPVPSYHARCMESIHVMRSELLLDIVVASGAVRVSQWSTSGFLTAHLSQPHLEYNS